MAQLSSVPKAQRPGVRLFPVAGPPAAPSERPSRPPEVGRLPARRFGGKSRLRVAATVGIAVLLVLIGMAAAWRYRVASAEPLSVARVRRGPISERIPTVAPGRVSAERELGLRAEFGTRVMVVHKRPGDHVTGGDLLVSLELEQAQNSVRAAEQALTTARAVAAESALRAELARKRDRRTRRLFAGGATPAADAENAHLESRIADQAARIADSRVSEQAESLRAAQLTLSHGDVRAPFDGIVLSLPVEVGQTVLSGALLVSVADISALHVAASIDEADLSRVRAGMPVELSFEAEPGRTYRKFVTEIDPSVSSNERGARVVGLEIELEPGANLKVGMSAQVDIVTSERAAALLVPSNVLIGTGANREVALLQDDKVVRRAVTVGISSWDTVEVSRGLAAGDLVVLNPAHGDSKESAAAPAGDARPKSK